MGFADKTPAKPAGQRAFGRRATPPENTPGPACADAPTVMMMAYDWGTGAHAVVTDRLSQALQRRGCKVVIFTDEQTKARMNGFANLDGRLEVVTHPDFTIEQPSYFEAIFIQHKPDIIITEHYPMDGSRSAIDTKMINPCLKRAHEICAEKGWSLQVHALVRDIPDAEILPESHKLKHYDHFIIRGDEKLYSYAEHFLQDQQWRDIKDKLHYVGYAASPPTIPQRKDNSVVVSLGGGLITGDRNTYENILQAIRQLPKGSELAHKRWHIYAPEALQQDLKKEAKWCKTEIEIHPFDDTFEQGMKRADMVICRGGMTAIEAVANNIPALIIPRQYEYGGEQKTRAQALARHAPNRVVVMDEKSGAIPTDLHEPMQRAYGLRHVKASCPLALNGHENAADAIIGWHHGREPAARDGAALLIR